MSEVFDAGHEYNDMSEFESGFLLPETNIHSSDMTRLARIVLLEAKSTRNLYRTISNRALIWAAFGATDHVFERSSYAIERDSDTDQWRMRYRYLKQTPDDTVGWQGILYSYDLKWNTRLGNMNGTLTEHGVPSISKDEGERLRSLFLMQQLREDNVGVKTFRDLKMFEDMGIEPNERLVFSDEIPLIGETVVRLNQARAEKRKRRFAGMFAQKAA